MSSAENEKRSSQSVLLLEDDEALAAVLSEFLSDTGWSVRVAGTVAEARRLISLEVFDLVLADYLLPDADGLSILEDVQRRSPLTKVMIMTGVADIETAARAIKEGASDLISKPFDILDLEDRALKLLEEKEEKVEKRSRPSSAVAAAASAVRMVGQSSALRKVLRLIDLVADKNVTVLISGESGTGKELVARALHIRSSRKGKAFVALNCGAIPENLLEDELFGHVRGAYTDARQARPGRFEQADGGTLFLDEIGTMPASLQVKLLRVLETREVERLGGNQTIPVDVRVVAATNAELKEKVASGEFRADLYYRLNVVPIVLPPLRARREDIPLLAHHFSELACVQFRTAPKPLTPAALKLLCRNPWPGNIRELRNTIELAVVLSDDNDTLDVMDFPSLLDSTSETGDSEEGLLEAFLELPEEGIDLNQVVTELEKKLIYQSLKRTQGNKGKAARLLSLKRTTLVEKLRRMRLQEES